jgi:hypothetical protein
MLIVNKKLFHRGLVLLVTFACVFASLFMPIWGKGENGLNEADDLFNRLSKGSSYFIPGVQKQVAKLEGKSVTVTVKVKEADLAARAVENLKKAGAEAEFKDGAVTYSGDLGKILAAALVDADDMFKDNGKAVLDRYGFTPEAITPLAAQMKAAADKALGADRPAERKLDEAAAKKEAEGLVAKGLTKAWWVLLDASVKPLQKQKMIEEAKLVGQVNKRGIEPGYNFYGVPSVKVMDSVLPLVGLLVFYVVYTMWYGYAIFDMFAGIGLSMSKPKVKKEA